MAEVDFISNPYCGSDQTEKDFSKAADVTWSFCSIPTL